MPLRPTFASGWYTSAPVSQLRQELQRVYRLLEESATMQAIAHGERGGATRPEAIIVYWMGEAQPEHPQVGDIWLAPSGGTLKVFDGMAWN